MNRKACLALLALATCVVGLFAAAPAGAIVGGQRDTVHTNVGLVRFTTADGRFRCSGTLIAPTVVLTAGHCTEGPATDVYVSFDTDLALDPLAPGITAEEKANRVAHYITGTAHPDPGWTGKLPEGVTEYKSPTGTVWIIGRILYWNGYKEAANKRSMGFAVQATAAFALWLGVLGTIAWRMIRF